MKRQVFTAENAEPAENSADRGKANGKAERGKANAGCHAFARESVRLL